MHHQLLEESMVEGASGIRDLKRVIIKYDHWGASLSRATIQ